MKKYILIIVAVFYCIPAISGTIPNRFDLLAEKIEKTNFSKGTQSKILLDSLFQMAAHSPDSTAMMWQCLYLQSLINRNQGVNDPLLTKKLETILEQADENKSPETCALLHYALALNYNMSGDYGKAFTVALEALKYYKSLKNTKFTEKSLSLLGTICGTIKNYDLAKSYYGEAWNLVKKPQTEYYQLYINMYPRLSFYTKQYQAAIDSLLAIIPELKQIQDEELLYVAYLNIGAAYVSIGAYDDAFTYYNALLSMIKDIDNKRFAISLYQNFGVYYYQVGDFHKAHEYFLKEKSLADETKNPEQQAHALYNLSFTFHKLGQYERAYDFLYDYNTLSSQLFNNAKAIEAYQSYVAVVLEASQNKLTIAEQKLELKQKQIILTAIIALAVIISALLLFIVAQQKKRIKVAENKELMQRLEQESKIMQLQEEKLQTQVREITSYSMLLAAKDNILQQISKLTDSLHSDQAELGEIKAIIQNNLDSNSDWKAFVLHFEKVHPDFFNKLKAYSNDLTKNDLRFCAYLRMGIDAKEIAQMLNVTHGSIRMHRYRIKKKLNLPEDANLDDFIRSIS